MQARRIAKPSVIVHCDWSKNPSRRWAARAVLDNGKYRATAPELVGDLLTFIQRVQPNLRDGSAVLIGFDFPIGLPKAYTQKIGTKSFLEFLKPLAADSQFFQVCRNQSEISLVRPFYPHAPGGRLRKHLTDMLGIGYAQLLRTCEQPQDNRPEAGALFWTLGAKQPGKAAIVGWRDVLAPALRAREIKVWPFHGSLDSLLQNNTTVVAETYPTQYYQDIVGQLKGPKGDRAVRAKASSQILAWAASRAKPVELSPHLQSAIEQGFPTGNDDAFDAAIGLFGMIDAIQNYSPALEPEDPILRNIEGWILGQPAQSI